MAIVGHCHRSGGFERGKIVDAIRLWIRASQRRWGRRAHARRVPATSIQRVISAESLTGVVFGMAATAVKPPAAAAAVPVAMVSL